MASFNHLYKPAEDKEKFLSGEIHSGQCDVIAKRSCDVFTGKPGNGEVSHPLLYRKSPKERWGPDVKLALVLNAVCITLTGLALCYCIILWGEFRELREKLQTTEAKLQEFSQASGIWNQDGRVEQRGGFIISEENSEEGVDNELLQNNNNAFIQRPLEKETGGSESETIIAEDPEPPHVTGGHLSRQKRSDVRSNRRRNGNRNADCRGSCGVTAIHLQGDSDTNFVGKKFEDWDVTSEPAVNSKVFVYQGGEVTIQTAGVYFVYSQVTYYTQFPSVAHTVNLKKPTETDTQAEVIMKCLSNIDRSAGNSSRFSSCYTGRAVYLAEGDSIFISDHHGQSDRNLIRTVDFSPENTYWGLIQLNDASMRNSNRNS